MDSEQANSRTMNYGSLDQQKHYPTNTKQKDSNMDDTYETKNDRTCTAKDLKDCTCGDES